MLISEESEVLTDKQRITCSSSLPLTVAQFAHTKGKLVVWEVHGTQKFCKLIKRAIRLDFDKTDGPFQEVYSIEGNIQIVNRHGDIYYVIPSSGSVNLIAKWNGERGDNNSCIAYIRNGILITGSDGTLKYFKRQKYVWNEIFQTPSTDPFVMLKGFYDNETVIGTTASGGLFKIVLSDGDKISTTKVKTYDPCYVFFALIYPTGDHLVSVDISNEIQVMSVATGEKISNVFIDNPTIVQSNPRYPFIAIGNDDGDVSCVSLFDPEHPKVFAEFLLSRWSITNIRFSDCGHFLVVIDADSNFFIIRSVVGEKTSILHHFRENIKIAEFFVVESRAKLEILFLCATSGDASSLMKVVVQLDDIDKMDKLERKLPARYTSILPIAGTTERFYAIRNGTRYIEVLELEGDALGVVDVIETPHQLRHIEGCNDGFNLVTWSMDGIAAVYDINDDHKLLVAFVANNRHNYGTKIAHCDAKRHVMVTLDQVGNLICSKLNIVKAPEEEQKFATAMDESLKKVAERFSMVTSGGFPGLSMENYGKKFTDLKSEQTYQMEARESEQTRKLLFEKLDQLRSQVKVLLDENEAHTADEKLEIQDFNLDLVTTTQKEMEAKEERDHEEKKMMDFIDAQTAMNNWTVDKCWNPMEVKGAKLRGMFIRLFVDNYPLLAEENSGQMESIKLMRAIENAVARDDAFFPWRPIPTM